ncbi:MAG: hypothetical protein JEZ00_21605 [Anaerolineaceae bacterium]|nr:hypothetical protein [Anaerolineaceae bacterium]
MAEFIREHALITLAIILLLIIAGNVGMFLQSKDPQKNLRDWFAMKNASESMGDPWKEENAQLDELSQRVADLKKNTQSEQDSED